jgi:membrane protease subunit (stomatin/prohibitin family)
MSNLWLLNPSSCHSTLQIGLLLFAALLRVVSAVVRGSRSGILTHTGRSSILGEIFSGTYLFPAASLANLSLNCAYLTKGSQVAIIDLVKWDGSAQLLAWKFPSQELSTWTQLVVNESQDAYVVRGGVYDGPFGAGRHTLTTENLPGLRGVLGLPFGGKSPFSAEVWFVNKLTNLDVRWGTPNPIQLLDPRYKIMVQVRAFGQYGIRITDSKRFLLKLVGSVPQFDVDTLSEYFRGAFITRIKTEIARLIIQQEQSILEVSTQLEALSSGLKQSLQAEVADYGVTLVQFNVHSINVPEDDPAAVTLKAALAKKAEMGIVGFTYQQERSFDVMQTAAGNEGSVGSVMGAGMGAGMGLGVGASLGQAYTQMASEVREGAQTTHPAPTPPPPVPTASRDSAPIDAGERIRLLKELATLKADGILTDEEFAAEKKKLLGS